MTEIPDIKDEFLTKYLLNELSRRENEALEEEMALSAELADRVRALEMNLIDAYVLGEMSPAESARFEEGFYLLPGNRRKVADAHIFHESLGAIRKERAAGQAAAATGASWRERLASLLRTPAFAVPALLLLAAAVGFLILRGIGEQRGSGGDANLTVNANTQQPQRPEGNRGGDANDNAPRQAADRPGGESPDPATGQPTPTPRTLEPPPQMMARNPRRRGTSSAVLNEASGTVTGDVLGEAVTAKPITADKNSEILKLQINLIETEYEAGDGPLLVAIKNRRSDVENVFPRGNKFQPITPKLIGNNKAAYSVTIKIPTRLLKDEAIYYFTLIKDTDGMKRTSQTPFKVRLLERRR